MSQLLVERADQRVASPWQTRIIDASVVVGASLLMATCAHVAIPLWFTPVPITLQTLGVTLLALTLGPWRASTALLLYLAEGASGLPVFNPHGPGGIAQILGPTGGYLMMYPVAALACGMLAKRLSFLPRTVAFGFGAIACDALILFGGATWLFAITHRSPSSILSLAVIPFLPGEVLKGAAAVSAALGLRRLTT